MLEGDGLDERGKVALHVEAKGEEVGDHDDAVGTGRGKTGGSAGEIRGAEFEKGWFDEGKATGAGKGGGNITDGLIGRFDTRAVCEEDVTGGH